jgi:hypothetical protein
MFMSNEPPHAQPPTSPPRPARRPGAVTAASAIMIVIASLGLVIVIANLASLNRTEERFRELAGRTNATPGEIDSVASLITVGVVLASVLSLLFAALLLGLALGNLRGSNAARIATWVVSGLGLLCGCCGLVGVIGQGSLAGGTAARTADELGRALVDAYPSWWLALNGGLSAAQALGYIAVAVLLALPAANAYFGRPAPQRQPPSTPPM